MIRLTKIMFGFLCLLVMIGLQVPSVFAYDEQYYVGKAEAHLVSVTNYYVTCEPVLRQTLDINQRIALVHPAAGGVLQLYVNFRQRDDSRVSGYPLYVGAFINRYNFQTWTLVDPHQYTNTAANTGWGKYDTPTTWYVRPNRPNAVEMYEVSLEARTKNDRFDRKTAQFFVASVVVGNRASDTVANSVPRWIAGRLTRALMYRNLANLWRVMSSSTPPTTINVNNEMNYLLGEICVLASRTPFLPSMTTSNPLTFALSSGLDVLRIINPAFNDMTLLLAQSTSPLLYNSLSGTYYVDAKNILEGSWNLLDQGFSSTIACLATGVDAAASTLLTALRDLATALVTEAYELMRLYYIDLWGSFTNWTTYLQQEKLSVKSALDANGNRQSYAESYLNARVGGPGTGAACTQLLALIANALTTDQQVLNRALGV